MRNPTTRPAASVSHPQRRVTEDADVPFDAEAWAKRQPHSFYSHWPTATMTKCDFCGTYKKDHAPDVPDEINVSLHPMKAIKGGIDPANWPVQK